MPGRRRRIKLGKRFSADAMKRTGQRAFLALALLGLYLGPPLFMWQQVKVVRHAVSSASATREISVLDYGAVGDGVTDDGAAFEAAFADAFKHGSPVLIPRRTYVINRPLKITSGMVIRSTGATLTHTDSTIAILSARKADAWVIQGPLTLSGTRTEKGQHDTETGLSLAGCSRYIVDKLSVTDFRGTGIRIAGKPEGKGSGRGDQGQYAFVSFRNNTVGLQIDEGTGAEYNLFTLLSFSGNETAARIVAGNNVISASNVVDNVGGLALTAGSNHGHGIFNAVNINHNKTFNVHAYNQLNGYTFSGCHVYGDSPTAGTVHLERSNGVHFFGGIIGATVINDGGGTNVITNTFVPGPRFNVTGNNACSLYTDTLFDRDRMLTWADTHNALSHCTTPQPEPARQRIQ